MMMMPGTTACSHFTKAPSSSSSSGVTTTTGGGGGRGGLGCTSTSSALFSSPFFSSSSSSRSAGDGGGRIATLEGYELSSSQAGVSSSSLFFSEEAHPPFPHLTEEDRQLLLEYEREMELASVWRHQYCNGDASAFSQRQKLQRRESNNRHYEATSAFFPASAHRHCHTAACTTSMRSTGGGSRAPSGLSGPSVSPGVDSTPSTSSSSSHPYRTAQGGGEAGDLSSKNVSPFRIPVLVKPVFPCSEDAFYPVRVRTRSSSSSSSSSWKGRKGVEGRERGGGGEKEGVFVDKVISITHENASHTTATTTNAMPTTSSGSGSSELRAPKQQAAGAGAGQQQGVDEEAPSPPAAAHALLSSSSSSSWACLSQPCVAKPGYEGFHNPSKALCGQGEAAGGEDSRLALTSSSGRHSEGERGKALMMMTTTTTGGEKEKNGMPHLGVEASSSSSSFSSSLQASFYPFSPDEHEVKPRRSQGSDGASTTSLVSTAMDSLSMGLRGGGGDDEEERDDICGQSTSIVYDCFHLKVVFERGRTGFEDHRELVLPPGLLFAGRYEVEREVGRAAFSRCLRCIDTVTNQKVCLKVIQNVKEYMDQSLDEVKTLRFLNANGDPDALHFLRLCDFFYHREHLVLVTELLSQNLYEFSSFFRKNHLPSFWTIGRIQRISFELLIALRFVHSLHIIHCDLKPENILLKPTDITDTKFYRSLIGLSPDAVIRTTSTYQNKYRRTLVSPASSSSSPSSATAAVGTAGHNSLASSRLLSHTRTRQGTDGVEGEVEEKEEVLEEQGRGGKGGGGGGGFSSLLMSHGSTRMISSTGQSRDFPQFGCGSGFSEKSRGGGGGAEEDEDEASASLRLAGASSPLAPGWGVFPVNEEGVSVKLIDFGNSCLTTDSLISYVQSRSYRAPEVLLELPYDTKIDIWSLGCVLFELWSGVVLFSNDSIQSLLARIVGIIGPIPWYMAERSPKRDEYFDTDGYLYMILSSPKTSSSSSHKHHGLGAAGVAKGEPRESEGEEEEEGQEKDLGGSSASGAQASSSYHATTGSKNLTAAGQTSKKKPTAGRGGGGGGESTTGTSSSQKSKKTRGGSNSSSRGKTKAQAGGGGGGEGSQACAGSSSTTSARGHGGADSSSSSSSASASVGFARGGTSSGGGRMLRFLLPKKSSLEQRMRVDDPVYLDFLLKMLTIDPAQRWDAHQLLRHPFLQRGRYPDGL